jgi:hypothetical protein
VSTATVSPPTSPATTPKWELAAESFLPPARRSAARRVVPHLPLGLVLVVQAFGALRLDNSLFSDEALYVYTGRLIINSWFGGEEVYTEPETFFSGAPQLYPVLMGALDMAGGSVLIRLFSTLCMLGATVAIYWLTGQLFAERYDARRAGLFAAVVFALSPPVLFLTDFATFDAPSFSLLAGAAALAVWSARQRKSLGWSVLVGLLLALSVGFKYASAVDVPFVLLVGLVGAWQIRPQRGRVLLRAAIAGVTLLIVVGVSAPTWARPLLAGLSSTTTARDVGAISSSLDLVEDVLVWSGPTIALCVVGGLALLRRRPGLALLLLAGTLAAVAYQIGMQERTSLHKHIVLGLIFGAPLAGAFLARVVRVRFAVLAVLAGLWGVLLYGLDQSEKMYTDWPETRDLVTVLGYPIDEMPWIRMVGESPEPVQYAFRESTEPWQWTATYENSFTYEGLTGTEAYLAALEDNYFQLAFLDGSSAIGSELIPQMERLGFERTDLVQTPGTSWPGHAWYVYQRFDDIPQ